MEFWGVAVKAGETVKCEPGEERLLHLSNAALGETKNKGAENVPIYVKFNDQKLVLGTLSVEKCPQISFDLVFEKEFELSHGSKNATVHFAGYKTDLPEDDEFPSDFDESDSEEDVPVAQNATKGALKVKSQEEKPAKAKSNVDNDDNAAAKAKAKAGKQIKAEPTPDDEDDEDDSDFEDDNDDSDGSDDDVDMMEAMEDSDDDADSDGDDEDGDESSEEEEDEETPKKSANGKKRPAEAALKTSGTGKKGGDGKKGSPAKQSGKAQANSDKPKQQTPKSGGTPKFSKSFKSEKAPKKAKHGGAK